MANPEGTADLAGLIDALDIVHRSSPENVERLLSVLDTLDARVRDLAGRDLRPEREAVGSASSICRR